MSRSRLGSVALGWLLVLASDCSRGGADSNVEVSMPDVVEAEIGETAIINCQPSLPDNGSYAYISWFSMNGRQERKRVMYMIKGKEYHDSPVNSRLSIAANFSLIISKVSLQDAKTYGCQASFGVTGFGENRSELRVSKAPEKPEIRKISSFITASDPEMSEVAECISHNGYPTPTLTWYKDDVHLKPDRKQIEIHPVVTKESSGLSTVRSTLLAQITKEDRKAIFHCQVNYNLMGMNKTSKSESITVDVHYPSESISFVIDSPSPEVKEGDNVTLRCEADGNPPPLYTLSRAEEENLLEPETGVLPIYNIQKEDSGIYRCKMLDLQAITDVELIANVTLFVNYLDVPTLTSVPPMPSSRLLKEGENLFLTCNTTGSKPLEFQWEKEGERFPKGNLLNLTNISYKTSGNYTCVVTMPDIPDFSRSNRVEVVVHAKPVLVAPKGVVHVQEGEMVNLTCNITSFIPVTNSWSVNGTIYSYKQKNQRTSTIQIQVTKALLKSGVNCSAKNRMGTSEHHFKLVPRQGTDTPHNKSEKTTQESKGVIIVAVVICILVIAILGAVLYFLHKKGKLTCGRSGKQEMERNTSI
ncbi:cell surface glycoprotein MUC18 isoform X2 [Rhineura floridana]|uniref:cell surface glycoprotein MUC18 isoform X2 n=1 Tax=Rhineura floridana TaxID=261503 RepID=UPI002AC820BE|nr:cell surface glycoprotein MUC18 isoform X2 [Rhineura floridana]